MEVTITPEMLRRWAEQGEDETTIAGNLSPIDHAIVTQPVKGLKGRATRLTKTQPAASDVLAYLGTNKAPK